MYGYFYCCLLCWLIFGEDKKCLHLWMLIPILIRTLYKIVVACMGIFATFALSLKYVMQDNSAKYMRILLHLGTITLGVYACHFLVISPVLLIFSGLWYPLKLVLAFILVTTLSYTIVRILSLNRYTAFILLGIAVNTKNKF